MISGGTDSKVRLWKVKGMEQVAKLSGHVSTLYASAVHPSGGLAATADASGKVILWDVEGEKSVWTLEAGGRLNGLAFSPDGALLCRVRPHFGFPG